MAGRSAEPRRAWPRGACGKAGMAGTKRERDDEAAGVSSALLRVWWRGRAVACWGALDAVREKPRSAGISGAYKVFGSDPNQPLDNHVNVAAVGRMSKQLEMSGVEEWVRVVGICENF